MAARPGHVPVPTGQRGTFMRRTPEEYEALMGPYNKCMQEHGGAVKSKGKAGRGP